MKVRDAARSASRAPTMARRPSQERGRLRFHALLDATDALLTEHDFEDVGLYQIAERAGVPPASVYHFFPTKGAAFLALAERYLDQFLAITSEPVDRALLHSWQDLLTILLARGVAFYNSHLPLRKLFLGANVTSGVRKADVAFVADLAARSYPSWDSYFHMPFVLDPERKFSVMIGIHDGIWMTSYARHGIITEEFAAEARTACIAYLRTFLPEFLPPRVPAAKPAG